MNFKILKERKTKVIQNLEEISYWKSALELVTKVEFEIIHPFRIRPSNF